MAEYEKKSKKPQPGETDGRSRGRGVSFRFDEDVFTSVWAKHNKSFNDTNLNSLSSGELYEAFRSFTLEVFRAHVSGEVAESYGCKKMVHNEHEKFLGHKKLGSIVSGRGFNLKGEDAEAIIYLYLYEKVKRKVDELLPVINEYNPAVTEPIGMDKAGWLWSRERKIQSWADKFNT
jgi:hypothetical protein